MLHCSEELVAIQLRRARRQAEPLKKAKLPLRDVGADPAQRLGQSRSGNHADRDRLAVEIGAIAGNRLNRMTKRVPVMENGPQARLLMFVFLDDIRFEPATSRDD